jgi:hypothetical protein
MRRSEVYGPVLVLYTARHKRGISGTGSGEDCPFNTPIC